MSVRLCDTNLSRALNLHLSGSDLLFAISALSALSLHSLSYFAGQTEPKILRFVLFIPRQKIKNWICYDHDNWIGIHVSQLRAGNSYSDCDCLWSDSDRNAPALWQHYVLVPLLWEEMVTGYSSPEHLFELYQDSWDDQMVLLVCNHLNLIKQFGQMLFVLIC